MKKKFKGSLVLSLAFVFGLFCQGAFADIFYTTSNHSTGSVGLLDRGKDVWTVNKNLLTNLAGDSYAYGFNDPDGRSRAFVREYSYGPNDNVMGFDPHNWGAPLFETKEWGSNIHAAASSGRYLYVVTYERRAAENPQEQLPGEIVRIDMGDAYRVDKRVPKENVTIQGKTYSPRGDGIVVVGDNVYVLWSLADAEFKSYLPSELVKMTKELAVVKTALVGKNTGSPSVGNMAYHGGKLYVAALGGAQGDDDGEIHEVDVSTMAVREVLDGETIDIYEDTAGTKKLSPGIHGVAIGKDGTVLVLAGAYTADWSAFVANLFKTTVSGLSAGKIGEKIADFRSTGFSWTVMFDPYGEKFWAMAGKELKMFNKVGTLERTFTSAELGDNIYSIVAVASKQGAPTPTPPASDDESGSGGGGCSNGFGGVFVCLAAFVLRRAATAGRKGR